MRFMSRKNMFKTSNSLSRRDFLKIAGATLAAISLQKASGVLAGALQLDLDKSPHWWYGLPRLKDGHPVVPRTIEISGLGHRNTIEIPCVYQGPPDGQVLFLPHGLQFKGGGHLVTNPLWAALSLKEQFRANLNYELPDTVLATGTYSRFLVNPISKHFSIIAPTKDGSVCVPALSLLSEAERWQVGYTLPKGSSKSRLFEASYLRAPLHVIQVTRATPETIGFPGKPGVNYWSGDEISPEFLDNDPGSIFCEPFEIDTTKSDQFYIGYSPEDEATGNPSEGSLYELLADPESSRDRGD
jgi:hypothetical protein